VQLLPSPESPTSVTTLRDDATAAGSAIEFIRKGWNDMQETPQDLFRQVLEKVKKSSVWEKLTPAQKEALITQYLQRHFKTNSQ
jgi:hypothetical protein